jgi:hypothetical protein
MVRPAAGGCLRLLAGQCGVSMLAQGTHDTANKLSLLDLARAWLAIAEQGEKNRNSPTLVYETPPRHE